MTLSELLTIRAEKYPEKLLVKFENQAVSYAEMDRRVTFSAGGLNAEGLKRSDKAAILMDNCPEYIITYFAILRAGGVVIPLNNFLTPEELSYILNDSDCRILLYNDTYSRAIDEIRENCRDVRFIHIKTLPQEKTEPVLCDENDVAVFLYTSGTTGFPKGVMLTHRNLLSNAEACIKAMNVTHEDRVLLFLPLFHAFSFTVCVLLPIRAGASIRLLASVKPFSNIIKSIIRDRITLFVAVPAVYNILSKKKLPFYAKILMKILVKIRLCISGAAALPENTLREFEKRFNIPLIEGYGLTEASPVISVNPLNGVRKPASVGLPLSGIEVAVAGEDGSQLQKNETGELIVRGPNIMMGYYKKEEESQAVLKDGWLYTGDLVRIDADGYIFIMDRKKDLIIIDGMNIYPREVEDLVVQHPSVEECAMVGIPNEKGSEISYLFIKVKEGSAAGDEEIREMLKGRIAQFKMPKRIRFIDEFPKTATGKIKKSELRNMRV